MSIGAYISDEEFIRAIGERPDQRTMLLSVPCYKCHHLNFYTVGIDSIGYSFIVVRDNEEDNYIYSSSSGYAYCRNSACKTLLNIREVVYHMFHPEDPF